jgi:hypothetical protein
MKTALIKYSALFFFFFSILSAQNDLVDRFSSNTPLPKLNVIGIAISEDVDAAKYVMNDVIKEQMDYAVDFNIYVDPTYKKLGDKSGFDLSVFGKSVTGKKYESNLDTKLELNANSHTMMVLDRQKRVRAFSQVSTIDIDNFSRVVEELLLNLNGNEDITIDSEKPDEAFGWQTTLGKENYEKENENTLVIDFGAGEEYWYDYLGEEIPDVELLKMEGTKTSLHELLGDNQVSVVLVYLASKDPGNFMSLSGISIQLMYVNGLYHSFTLGEAEPGDEFVENAVLVTGDR